MLKKRKEIVEAYSNMTFPVKDILLTGLTSLIMAILVCMGPIVLFVNLYIFDSIKYFACFLVASSIGLIYILFNYFYYKGMTKGKIEKLYLIHLPYDIFILALIYVLYLILVFRGILWFILLA